MHTTTERDDGFSLIELLLVILILGIVTADVTLSVSGITSEAEDSACLADRRTLEKATEAYFAQRSAEAIPPAGVDEPYEQTLVNTGFLRGASQYFDVDANGDLTDTGQPCDG